MRLPVLEIEVRQNCWPSSCKAFPQFNRQLGNRLGLVGSYVAPPGHLKAAPTGLGTPSYLSYFQTGPPSVRRRDGAAGKNGKIGNVIGESASLMVAGFSRPSGLRS